ncbi:MAG: ABC transporter ATP-binding protein [Elusimicrobiota bacterium]|nr:ABC transporter ATP-binding protein [Endomicrobiia bacterium]MDW8165507.1 ABC transporter ATP-binding protein [Elusimicrobiota bacterium]
MEILKVKNIFSGYGKYDIIRNVSFEVLESEFVGIIGPNAVGKSTLLKTLARIVKLRSGEIIIDNKEIRKYNYKEFAKIVGFASTITDYSLNFKVKDFIFLARYPWDFSDINYEELYEEFELRPILNKPLKDLSSGELQRVLIAQVIAQTPKIYILDEPVSHLDIGHQISILDKLKKINLDKKVTILASFHELNLAIEYCDKLILLFNGEIKKIGSAEEVIDYRILEEVYNTKVVVKTNPISNKPYVIAVPMMW